MGESETRGYGRTDHERCGLSEPHCEPVEPLHGDLKWNLPAGQSSMSRLELCWKNQEHNVEL